HAEDRAPQPQIHADMAGRRAGHGLRHREDASPRFSFEQDRPIVLLDDFPAAHANADGGPDPVRAGLVDRQAGMMRGLARGDHGQQAEAVHGHELLALDAVVGQFPDLAAGGDLDVMQRGIGNRPDSRPPGTHGVPDRRRTGAEAAKTAYAGDDDALAHAVPDQPFCAIRPRTASIMSPTFFRLAQASTVFISISMPYFSSRSKMISVSSSEWMPSEVSSVPTVISSSPG